MELHILGRVRLLTQEQIEIGATKVRGLLAYLSYKANEQVHVDRIAEALWDGDAPADAGKVLQTYVSRLRRVLRDADCPVTLSHEHRSYRLDIDRSTVDLHRFRATVRDGQRARGSGDRQAAADLFVAALALWSGPPFADLDTYWARRTRETLTTGDLIPAHCALFDTMLSLGDHDFVLNSLPPLLSDHAYDERLAIRWVRALAAADRAEEAPVFLREFAARLWDDLAAQPPAELVNAVREATARRPAPPQVRQPSPPRGTSDFTGRDDLLHQLDALLTATDRTVDVVALDGPAGIGKTALVGHWARTRLARFPGGVLHVDLAGYSDAPVVEPPVVMAMFLADLGVGPNQIPESTAERAALLRDLLATQAVLVCLDNARDSDHVRPLLEATSPCPALITSRQRLSGITYRDGVQLLSIPALPADEATALLAKRIGTRASDDPGAFARLVELCQGLPLALRIVAEHVAMRPLAPVAELADELSHAKRLLDAGSHGDSHATTLRCAFALSYHALREAERRLFRLLGLHPDTKFSVEAVTALAGGSTYEVVHQLDALVGAHLVTQEGAGRYSVHDLLHVYAADIVLEDEPAGLRDRATHRLFDWYLHSANHARTYLLGNDQNVPDLAPAEPVAAMAFTNNDEALRWLVTERPNLVACTYRAATLGYHDHVWRFAACLNVLSRHEDPRGLLDILELGRRSAELAGDIAAVGGCLNNKGAIYARLNDKENAGRCFDLAYEAFTKAGDEHGLAVFTHNTGSVRLALGQPTEAITWLDKSLAMHTRAGNERHIANCHRSLGDAYQKLENFTEARAHYCRSLYSSQKSNDLAGEAKSLSRLARLSVDENLLAEAIDYGEAALAMFDRVQVDQDGTATTLCILATAHLRLGDPAAAIVLAGEAAHRYEETGNAAGRIDALVLLSQAQAAEEPAEVIQDLLGADAARPVPAPRAEDAVGGERTRNARESVEDPS